jgi:hypothetical protein
MVTYKAPQPRMMMTRIGGAAPVTPERIQELQRTPPVVADYTVFFDEWRDADGLKFPFKMRRAMGSETIEEWTVTKVKVNPKVDPKRFAGES